MGLVCLLVVLLIQYRSILCLHPVNVLSLWCFYREYKTGHDWVGKGILWELCKRLKFKHNKRSQQKQESVLENETHKILWDFVIRTDHPISVRRPDLVFKKKKKRTCLLVDFAPANPRAKMKEIEKFDKYFDFARELKNLVEWENDDKINNSWRSRNRTPSVWKRNWRN